MPVIVTVGSSTTIGPYVVTGVEILAPLRPRDADVELDTAIVKRWARRMPERYVVFKPTLPLPTQQQPRVHILGSVFPERFARPRWAPPKSAVMAPILNLPTPPPPAGPRMVHLPERFLRSRWSPVRGFLVEPVPFSFPNIPYVTLTLPAKAYVNIPFTAFVTITNPGTARAFIEQVIPGWVQSDNTPSDEPGTLGPPYLAALPSLSHDVTALLGSGFVLLKPGASITYAFGVVLFSPGDATIEVEVDFQDGSTAMSGPATITAYVVS